MDDAAPVVVARFADVSEIDADPGLLTTAELARHGRLVAAADKQAYAAAHILVRECSAELLGARREDVVIRQRCGRCGAVEHGAPAVADFPGIWVSLSHARGQVAAVAATRRCGIDVERVSRGPDRALSSREAAWVAGQQDAAYAFTRLWVRKEALVKAGHGSMAAAQRLDVLAENGPADQLGGARITPWEAPGFVGAVAICADRRTGN
ncbi:4'-phosphopantetheinyl transferase superfamily protein [Nocardioides sp. KC13]|uniref:4'-phosphopantetheinyl transferase superfamily protein n=1 Tax=Nocardioides turkmenicus TaxID=2711220 RepID=A0A6M1QXE2_9ACTN|nr:4'-phosphopantetheinyl transferase superfamily protein [Nocardioides sp. KC13]NGN94675.1 4'-phosphopantetheinyl transferase superfamily protein [Nocardioides sp. KC13]